VGLGAAIDAHGAALLRRSGVNALRLINHGFLPWGARTVGSGSESGEDWKYVPVRRLALYLEQSIDRGLRIGADEPNDEPSWGRIHREITSFLTYTHFLGAFAGQTPAEAFFVRCGSDTTTQHDIENGVVNIDIGFAPLRPAEFLEFRIRRAWV
jgi:phage tail sheath protein FI